MAEPVSTRMEDTYTDRFVGTSSVGRIRPTKHEADLDFGLPSYGSSQPLSLNGFAGMSVSRGILFRKPKRQYPLQPANENLQLFKNSTSKPYYLLNSKELDIMIYYHQKYLLEARKEKDSKLKKKNQTDSEMLNELNNKYNSKSSKKPAQFFMTDIEVEKKKEEQAAQSKTNLQTADQMKELNAEQPSQPNNGEQEPAPEEPANQRRPITKSTDVRVHNTRRRGSHDEILRKKKGKGPVFLLDFRRKLEDEEEKKEEKLKQLYGQQPVLKSRTYFIPTIKKRMGEQEKKIQAYLKDCTVDHIRQLHVLHLPLVNYS